jgi:hypothetical protein
MTANTSIMQNTKYDIFGNVVKAQVSCCQEKSYTCTESNCWGMPEEVISGSTSGVHLKESIDTDFNTGLVSSKTDTNNQTINKSDDQARRLTGVEHPTGSSETTDYNDGSLSTSTTSAYDDNEVAKQITTTSNQDGWGREIQRVNVHGGQVNTTYDYNVANAPGVASTPTVTYTYDNVTTGPTNGLLLQVDVGTYRGCRRPGNYVRRRDRPCQCVYTFRPTTSNFFCAMVTLLCISGCLIINTLAGFWAAAYSLERGILGGVRAQFPTLPAGSTFILDGFCPRVGPAVVFRYSWDLEGALPTLYRDPRLRADIVTPRLKVAEEGLSETIDNEISLYAYGDNLLAYHVSRKAVYLLVDVESR